MEGFIILVLLLIIWIKVVNKTSFSKEISVRPMEIFKKYE